MRIQFLILCQVFMIAISRKMDQIKKEQQKSDDLLGKLLPANILPSLKNKKVKISYLNVRDDKLSYYLIISIT